MAYYAFLDNDNTVVEVITGNEENSEGINWEEWYGNYRGLTCKRTSYNTFAGKHSNPNKQQFRYNFAGVGFKFDSSKGEHGAFIPPKTYPSWVLDEDSCTWISPIPMPEDDTKYWVWNEGTVSWDEYIPPMPENIQP
jgi:hypothetical protein